MDITLISHDILVVRSNWSVKMILNLRAGDKERHQRGNIGQLRYHLQAVDSRSAQNRTLFLQEILLHEHKGVIEQCAKRFQQQIRECLMGSRKDHKFQM